MKAKRISLVLALLMCISLLCSCGAAAEHAALEYMPAASPRLDFGAASERLVPICKTHQFSEWTATQMTPGGPWMESRRCSVCGQTESRITDAPEPDVPERSILGSATKLSEKTVIVSIFANDSTTSWDFENRADMDMVNTMHRYLGNATSWIAKQCRAYDTTAEFVYDWKKNPDLYYTYDFGQTRLVRPDGGGYYTQEDYILANIDSEGLKKKYDANNIIYIFYFNTGTDNTVNSWCISDQSDCYTEIVNVFIRDDYSGGTYIMPASSMAHEILHCFGAYDLYYASEEIPQAYVDHLQKTGSRDIMYTVGLGGAITQKFTELDAYYVGLTDSCDEVETWGLARSRHELAP